MSILPFLGERYPLSGRNIVNADFGLDSDGVFTRASSAGCFVDNIDTTFITDVPRLGGYEIDSVDLGFIDEGASVNEIRNSTMVGAAVGTPGTLPTNWSGASDGGLTISVVELGVENGLSYIDVRWSGTTSSTFLTLVPEAITQISAVQNEGWVSSLYCKIVGGDTTNVSVINLGIVERDAGGSFLVQSLEPISPNSTIQRFTQTRTLTNAATAYVHPYFGLEFASGVAVDVTFRFSGVQMEEGVSATTYISTTTVAVTRATDVYSIDLTTANWFNPLEGTFVVDFVPAAVPPASEFRGIVTLNNNGSNRISILHRHTSGLVRMDVVTSGSTVFAGGDQSLAGGVRAKFAAAYKEDDCATSLGGSAVVTGSSVTLPTGLTSLEVGAGDSVAQFFGTYPSITYYATRLPNATLEKLST